MKQGREQLTEVYEGDHIAEMRRTEPDIKESIEIGNEKGLYDPTNLSFFSFTSSTFIYWQTPNSRTTGLRLISSLHSLRR